MLARPHTAVSLLLASATILGIGGCETTSGPGHAARNAGDRPDSMAVAVADDPDVIAVATLLTGTFDSLDQAAADTENFFEIRLVTIPIWTERTDGRWMYVEQAAFAALDRPYRQRVYRVHRDDTGVLRSDVYLLPGEPLEFTAAWRNPGIFDAYGPADLELRDGCSILLDPAGDGTYLGATVGNGCSSALGDAAYATSEVELRPGLILSWDRGWTTDGEQAWGATVSGYRFVQRSEFPPAPAQPDPTGS